MRLIIAVCLCLGGPPQEQIDEFVVAGGPPRFGEQPGISGNIVVWRRYSNGWPEEGKLQFRDISRMDSPVVDVVPHPASWGGVLLTPAFLYWVSPPPGEKRAIRARPTMNLASNSQDVEVSPYGYVAAANRDFVFIRVYSWEFAPEEIKKKLFGKAIRDFGNVSMNTLIPVAEYETDIQLDRSVAASEKYLVWQDRNPDSSSDTWKIYVKEIGEVFTPGSERLAVDTLVNAQERYNLRDLGVYLGIHDSLLVFLGAETAEPDGLVGVYLLDLEGGGKPMKIAEPDIIADGSDWLKWPAISSDYIVWTEETYTVRDGFFFQPFARRLIGGKPHGENFPISTGLTGAAWLTLDRNIAVWNGARLVEGNFIEDSVVAAELPLPGAVDLGDADQNGRVEVTDPIFILNYLFLGGWQPRRRPADADENGWVDVTDAVRILEHLFLGTGPLGAGRS